jgi:serine/threonine-protein kinase
MANTATSGDRISELAEEFLARHRAGLEPSVEAYAVAHAELAEEIRRLFPALLLMEDLKPASGDATGSFSAASVVVRGVRLGRLGDFRILREVGRGGMGVVYEAEQESLGRRVALKILATHALTDPAQVSRFEREARAAARLHHTNIVPVFGVGADEGLHYYVMQFIQGLGLDDVIAEVKRLRFLPPAAVEEATPPQESGHGPTAAGLARSLITEQFALAPPPLDDPSVATAPLGDGPDRPALSTPDATPDGSSRVVLGPSCLSSEAGHHARYGRGVARIGLQVARALEYAHAQGILHRDVKPSNLLLDVQGTAWVADFGLAKAVEGEDLTHTGDIVGTVRYMAPERFRGRCDPRADVYALGLTLYEMLALRPAFEQADRQALIRQVMEEEPPRLRTLAPAVPRDLETVVHKAIEKDPSGRYPTAAALAEDLALFLDGKPVRARQTGVLERGWKWAKRRPEVAALLAGLIVAMLTGLAAVTWQWRAAVGARDEARHTLEMANEAVNTYFAQVSEEQLLDEPGMQPLRKKLLEQALPYYKTFVKQKSDDPALRVALANAYLRWGRIASELDANEEAGASLKTAIDQFEAMLRSEPGNVEALAGLARAHQEFAQLRSFVDGQPEAGRREAEQAILSWKLVLSARPRDFEARRRLGRCHDLVGVTWGMDGNMRAALPHFQKAIDVLSEVMTDNAADAEGERLLAGAQSNLGIALQFDGRLTESEESLSRAVSLLEHLAASNASSLKLRGDLCRHRANLGRTRFYNGSISAAESELRENRRECEKLVRDNPSVHHYRYSLEHNDLYLGRTLATRGRTALARQVFEQGLAQAKELLRLNPNYMDAPNIPGEYYSAIGSFEGTLGQLGPARQALGIALPILTERHRRHPERMGELIDLLETTIASLSLEARVSRSPLLDERISEIEGLVQDLCRRTEQDPKSLWPASAAVSGYLTLADYSVTSASPEKALKPLDQAAALLEFSRRVSPDSLVLRCLSVRLETMRGEVLRRLDKNEAAVAAAKQAFSIGEKLADEDSAYLFDLACAHALRARLDPSAPGPPAAAVTALRAAIAEGFDNAYKLQNDDRLAPLATRSDFQALVRLVKEKTAIPAGRSDIPGQ